MMVEAYYIGMTALHFFKKKNKFWLTVIQPLVSYTTIDRSKNELSSPDKLSFAEVRLYWIEIILN